MGVDEASTVAENKRRFIKKDLVGETKISDSLEALFEGADGLIVLLDALGIRGIWNRKNPAEILNNWESLQIEYAKGLECLRNELMSHGYSEKLTFQGFSDTIMISLSVRKREVGSDRGRNPLWWTIMSMGELLSKLFRISIRSHFYFRGCLSAGRFYRSQNMIIGPTVDEAAEYYRLPEWSGISTCPSASKILTDSEEMRASFYDYFIPFDIPLKNMIEKNGWALNWPKSKDLTDNEKLGQILYDESRVTNGISAYFKIKNTLDFYDQVTSHLKK
jgi:hypothetical protein